MAKIPLRTYIRDIESLIDHGQIDEAVAHSKYILNSYPKLLAAYRMLGKAYLETKNYGDATDIFQRVLSAVPDDFVSQVGMSIIREDEGNQNAAIWHMERAFEVQPYNAAIQSELRRLYGRRDGLEPPKIRLTRGALARLYAKGNLYQQAIGELRAALSEDPQRPDLQALLARMYFLTGQRVEAAETCSLLLKKLPYCLDANRILAIILPETGRKEDSQVYQQREISLDPYLIYATPQAPSSDGVSENTVTLERLDYKFAGAPISPTSQPAWAASLGVTVNEFAPKEEKMPEWLSTTGEETEGIEGYRGPQTPPFVDLGAETKVTGVGQESLEPSQPIEPASAEGISIFPPGVSAPEETEEAIPDWLHQAGWKYSAKKTETPPAEKPSLYEEPTNVPGAETDGEATRAEVPDWLKAMAPPGAEETVTPPVEKPALIPTGEEVMPWLQETPPGPTDTIISWLGDLKGEGELPKTTHEEPITEKAGLEIPDWLRGLGEEIPSTPEAVVPPTEEVGLPTTTPEELPVSSIPTPVTNIPEAVPSELPDWLQGIAPETPYDEAVPAAGATFEEVTPAEPVTQGAEIPEWMPPVEEQEPVAEKPLLVESPAEAVPSEEFPSWLKDLGTESVLPEKPSEVEPVIIEIPQEAIPSEAIPDWLKGLGQEVPTDIETIPTEALSLKTLPTETPPPEVIPQEVTPEEVIPSVPPEEAIPGSELPDWLKSLEQAASTETAPTQEEAPEHALPVEQIPSWLRALEQEEEHRVEPTPEVAEVVQTEAIPQAEAPVTPPEVAVPAEELPAWLKSFEPETAQTHETPGAVTAEAGIEAAPPTEKEAPTPAEKVSEWLKALEAETPIGSQAGITPVEEFPAEVTTTPVEEVASSAVPGKLPDWLKAMQAEIPEEAPVTPVESPIEMPAETPVGVSVEEIAEAFAEAVPSVEAPAMDLSDQDSAMAWLESLAAKQGVPEEELTTKPEERPEAPPTWLEEFTPTVTAPTEQAPIEIPPEVAPVPTEAPPEAAPEISEPGFNLKDQDAALAWLESLAQKQGVAEEELLTKPEERLEAPPTWVREVATEEPAGMPSPNEQQVEPMPAGEAVPPVETVLPLTEIVTPPVETVVERTLEVAPKPAVEAEMPDWLKEIALPEEEEIPTQPVHLKKEEPVQPVEKVAPLEAVPQEQPPAETFPSVPEAVLSDQEAAMAWLESLAAKRGIPEEQLITKPEERPAVSVPHALAGQPPAVEAPVEHLPEETPPIITEPPATDQEAAMAWLESLAAKQGVPEEELLTKPEERPEAPPEWVQEQAIPEVSGVEGLTLPEVEEAAPEELVPSFEPEPSQWIVEVPTEQVQAEEIPSLETIEIPAAPLEAPIAETTVSVGEAFPAIQPAEELPVEMPTEAEIAEPVAIGLPVEEPPLIELQPIVEELPAVEVPAPSEKALPVEAPIHAIDVNKASLVELENLPGVGFIKAQSILNYRESHRAFTSLADLTSVPGITTDLLDELQDLIVVSVTPKLEEVPAPTIIVPVSGDANQEMLLQARAAFTQGDLVNTVSHYGKLIKTQTLLGEVISDLQKAVGQHSEDFFLWQTLGDAYMRNNQLEEAFEAYSKAEALLQ